MCPTAPPAGDSERAAGHPPHEPPAPSSASSCSQTSPRPEQKTARWKTRQDNAPQTETNRTNSNKSERQGSPTSFFVDLLRHFLTTENRPLVKRRSDRDKWGRIQEKRLHNYQHLNRKLGLWKIIFWQSVIYLPISQISEKVDSKFSFHWIPVPSYPESGQKREALTQEELFSCATSSVCHQFCLTLLWCTEETFATVQQTMDKASQYAVLIHVFMFFNHWGSHLSLGKKAKTKKHISKRENKEVFVPALRKCVCVCAQTYCCWATWPYLRPRMAGRPPSGWRPAPWTDSDLQGSACRFEHTPLCCWPPAAIATSLRVREEHKACLFAFLDANIFSFQLVPHTHCSTFLPVLHSVAADSTMSGWSWRRPVHHHRRAAGLLGHRSPGGCWDTCGRQKKQTHSQQTTAAALFWLSIDSKELLLNIWRLRTKLLETKISLSRHILLMV